MVHKFVKNKQWRVEKKIPAAVCHTLKHQYPDEYRKLCLPLFTCCLTKLHWQKSWRNYRLVIVEESLLPVSKGCQEGNMLCVQKKLSMMKKLHRNMRI